MPETRTDARWVPPLPDLTTTDGEVLSEGHDGYWHTYADVFLVIHEDRHDDVAVTVYSDQSEAEREAQRIVDANYSPLDRIHVSTIAELDELSELTDDMHAEGWTFNAAYSIEGGSVRVQRTKLIA